MSKNRLLELESLAFSKQPKQKTIDLIQEAEEKFNDSEDYTRDQLGAYLYQIGIVLDIINPELNEDIALLRKLKEILLSKFNSKI